MNLYVSINIYMATCLFKKTDAYGNLKKNGKDMNDLAARSKKKIEEFFFKKKRRRTLEPNDPACAFPSPLSPSVLQVGPTRQEHLQV